ncbi:hypothetical protein IPA_09165 [Ignicoccus pacificus DSM 13166]|uniref:Winged helix DNA-binding domain-containing protein n=1 Tax=Ignicoccus pacificus DSM 13166 TaxID=940294 RepID=A0A977KC14_9CREN|nr:hypothetical protein IPA_09165 [Ignicoccus pacificus DSM 13166]
MAILLYLAAKGEVKFKTLCKDLKLTPGNAWSHLEKLQREGLIEMKRELPITGSKVSVRLTKKGYERADEILKVISELSNLRYLLSGALEGSEGSEGD